MGKKGDLSDFEHGMIGARRADLRFQKLLIWDFHAHTILGFTENGLKKRKYPVSSSCVDKNALLMSRGHRMGRLVRDDKGNSNSNKHSLQPRYAEYHL